MGHTTSVLGLIGGQLLLSLAGVGLIGFGVYLGWRYRETSARYLAGSLVVSSLFPLSWMLQHWLQSEGASQAIQIIDTLVQNLGVVLGWPGAFWIWLAFVLAYTSAIGERERRLLAIGGVVVIFFISATTVILSFQQGGFISTGLSNVMLTNIWQVPAFALIFGIPVYGSIQLFKSAQTHTNFRYREAAMLAAPGLGTFLLISIAIISEIPMTEILGVGYLLEIGAVAVAVFQYRAFEEIPASQVVGQDTAVNTIESAIVVLNPKGTVINSNTAANELFGSTDNDITGSPLSGVLPDDTDASDIAAAGESIFELPSTNQFIRSHSSIATDDSGRELGRAIVFHDITDERRRQQRIQVLNRVLRHNLRNDLNAVNVYAELLEEEVTDTKEYAIQIQEMATELISIGEKAREIEEVVSAQQKSRQAMLSEAIEQAVEEVRELHGGCEISVNDIGRRDMQVNGTVLTSVLRELIENACRHNDADDPKVTIQTIAESGGSAVSIQVRDNGPGIPEHELTPLEEGTESALEHGSGLGLWLIDWGVATLNGDIEFRSNEPRGTMASLRLPLPD